MVEDEDDDYTLADAAQAATRMLRHGVSDAEIKDILPDHYQEGAFELARLRKTAGERFEDPWELFFDDRGLRYATPDVVARARVDRLSGHGEVAIDPACGVGIQLSFLAREFEQAVGVELDEDTAEMARRNLQAYEVDAEVIVADSLDPETRKRLPDPDVVVCDPARDPEAEERTFEGLSPDIRKIHETYTARAKAWCYELPPMMDPETIRDQLDGELEYTSLNGDLNRLALYGGQARQADRSALTLPSGERIDTRDPAAEIERVDEPSEVLHLVDRTVVQADLLDRLGHRIETSQLLSDEHPRRVLLTSDQPPSSAFVEDYRVLDTHTWNLMGLREKIKRLGAGHVTLRAGVDPDRYWDVRNALEQGLEGEGKVHLFRIDDRGLIVEPIEPASEDQQPSGS